MMRSIVTLLCSFALAASALAQDPYKPVVGQAGKDVVWVPTPPELVERMLDLAQVTADDFVVDLGSGDGRNVIAAAKRGARALGVEFNPEMVALSKRLAAEAGVSERASFVEGDMYEADISQATVMALFLLPGNMNRLEPKFLNLRPGTRIVGNTFGFDDWEPDVREDISGADCANWCTALLWIVPAKAGGTWAMADGTLSLQQSFQRLWGTLTTKAGAVDIANGRVRGELVEFIAGGQSYSARVTGQTMEGTVTTPGGARQWTARQQPPQ